MRDVVDIQREISPVTVSNSNKNYSYIHKSVYEFYIAQSIIEETLVAKLQPLDEKKTMLS